MAQCRPDRTLGGHHDTFWHWCDQQQLRLQRCVGCGELAWPAVDACEVCGAGDFTWEVMSGNGRIVSWCSFERDYYAGLLPMPWDTILVELDEGPLFLSNPQGFGWQDCRAGMRVRATFIPCEDSGGPFLLPAFERA